MPFKLLPELWTIVGEYLHADVEETRPGELTIEYWPSNHFTLEFDGDRTYLFPGCATQ